MKIFKAKSDVILLWDLTQWIENNPDCYMSRIGISWKVKKRRKLRSYGIGISYWECDNCGPITSITLTKGGKTYKMDNHFGPSRMFITDL